MEWVHTLAALVLLLTGLVALALAAVFAAVRDGQQRAVLLVLLVAIGIEAGLRATAMLAHWTGGALATADCAAIVMLAGGVASLAWYVAGGKSRTRGGNGKAKD